MAWYEPGNEKNALTWENGASIGKLHAWVGRKWPSAPTRQASGFRKVS